MNSKLPRPRRLWAESLESRQLLTVSTQLTAGVLCIVGDARDNNIAVTEAHGLVYVSSDSWWAPRSFANVKGLNINLDGGCDTLDLEDLDLKGDVCVAMGTGDDKVSIGSWCNSSSSDVCIGGALSVDLGAGCNTLKETATSVKLDETIASGDGNDSVSIGRAGCLSWSDVAICGSLTANLGSGDNTVCETSTSVKLCESVCTGDGKDTVTFGPAAATSCADVTIGKDLSVTLGAGKNGLTGYDLAVCGSLTVSACANGANNPDDTVALDKTSVACDAVFNLLGCGVQKVMIGGNANPHNSPSTHESAVGGDLKITTGSGSDCVQESSLTVGGCNAISTDGGDDTVKLGGADVSVCKDVTINLGKGKCDTLAADCVHASGNFCVTGGADSVALDLESVLVSHLLSLVAGSGADKVTIGNGSKADSLIISTDGCDDQVCIDKSTFNSASVKLGGGDHDSLKVSNTTICNASFDGGTGHHDTYINGGGNCISHLTKKNFE